MNLLKFLYRDPPKKEANQKYIKHVIYSNDDEYQGEVLNEKRHGQGTYKFASGNRYEGEWKAHQKHGKGKLYYKNGELYIGNWVENLKQGEGMHFYINGDRYVGGWKEDQKDGEGTIYQADHNIFHGQFRMNKKCGSGYFYNTREKKYYKQHYENDNLVDNVPIEEIPPYVQQKFHTKPEKHQHEPVQQQQDIIVPIDASPLIENDSDKQKELQPSPSGSGQNESDTIKQEEGKYNSLVNSQQHGFLSLQVLEKIEEFENQKNMQEWQVEEVCNWLDSLELGQYKEEFSKNQMTGKTLYGLTDNELKQDLGILVLGHRKKILQSIEEYKKYYVKFMEGRIRLKKPFESIEDRKGLLTSIDQQRFKNIFSYMEKIDEEQPEYHEDPEESRSRSSSDDTRNSHRKKKNRETPTPSSDEQDENNLSDNISMKIKRQKSKKSKKQRKATVDVQKSGESADDEEGKQKLSSPQSILLIYVDSPMKLSNQHSDSKIDIILLNECSVAEDQSKDKDSSNITQELSRQQSTNKPEVVEFSQSKSPPQNTNDEIPLERIPSLAVQQSISRQKYEQNGNMKFQDQESSSQESDISGNDTSSDSSEEEKEKPIKQKKSKRHKEHKKEKEEHQQQHHLPKKLLVMLKEFGINERVLIVFHELTIGQIIGEGGYGVVHKGKWLGQDVAIKSYGKRKSQGKLKYKLQMADFLKEVEVISNLRHPNIVLYMGVCIRKQNYYLITEYLEEGSLFDHLHKKKTHIDQKAIMQIVEDIALGMNYLHGRKVMHCDLKSSNVLIDQNWNVKLCDFGLSRINKKIEHKKVGARIGTPHWMAPEIMRGEPYQEKADVYSFGMILWEIITQQIPYEGLSQTQIIGSVGYGHDQVPIPPNSNPPILLQLVKKCLKKKLEERPNFADIVNEIQMGQKTDAKLKKQAIRQLIDFFE